MAPPSIDYRKIPSGSGGSGGTGSSDDSGTVITGVTCDASVFVGAVVRMNGTTAVNAQADNKTNSRAVGIVENKPTSTTCDIRVAGFVSDAVFSLVVGNTYFLSASSAGAVTSTPPTGSGQYVVRIGKPLDTQTISLDLATPVKRN